MNDLNHELYIVCPNMNNAWDLYSKTKELLGVIFILKTYELPEILQIHFKNGKSFYFVSSSYNHYFSGRRRLVELSSSQYEHWLKEFELQQRTIKYLGRKR